MTSARRWWLDAGDGKTTTPPPPPQPGTVQPISALTLLPYYGVQGHPNRSDLIYAGSSATTPTFRASNIDAWVSRYAAMGASYFRGVYVPSHPGTAAAISAARKYGMKWLMICNTEGGCTPTNMTLTQTADVVRDVASRAADVCFGLEGLNEPNHNRGSNPDGSECPVPSNWAATTVAHQKVIYDTARADSRLAGVPVVGGSLHDVMVDDSYKAAPGSSPVGGFRHYHQLADNGILDVQDFAGFHGYPSGGPPLFNFARRINYIDSAYGVPAGVKHYPTWLTEWGYHNALATTAGHRPASESATATYAPRGFIQILAREGVRVCWYEGLDDWDAGAKDIHEHNFGLWRVGTADVQSSFDPATWAPKPAVGTLRTYLQALKDPAGTAPYTPTPVALKVDSLGALDVQWVTTATADGATSLWVWRNLDVWNPTARTPITVSPTPVVVTDALGARTFQVDADVALVTVRR